jgi:hypothetical protein
MPSTTSSSPSSPSPAAAAPPPRDLATSAPEVEIRWAGDDASVFARADIAPGAVLISLAHCFVTHRERHTIQIDAVRHQAFTDEIDDYVNHSCDPNSYLDFERLEVIALRPIAEGEEIRHNYLTFEWEMASPFACACGAAGCVGEVRGYRFLTATQRRAIAPLISPYLREQRAAAGASAASAA